MVAVQEKTEGLRNQTLNIGHDLFDKIMHALPCKFDYGIEIETNEGRYKTYCHECSIDKKQAEIAETWHGMDGMFYTVLKTLLKQTANDIYHDYVNVMKTLAMLNRNTKHGKVDDMRKRIDDSILEHGKTTAKIGQGRLFVSRNMLGEFFEDAPKMKMNVMKVGVEENLYPIGTYHGYTVFVVNDDKDDFVIVSHESKCCLHGKHCSLVAEDGYRDDGDYVARTSFDGYIEIDDDASEYYEIFR